MGVFNTKRWLEKRANINYEGAQGFFVAHQRAWMNCCKDKMDAGAPAQKSWFDCLDEYQKGASNHDWVGKYASDAKSALEKSGRANAPQYGERIAKKMASGKDVRSAVMETLEECDKDPSVATPKSA